MIDVKVTGLDLGSGSIVEQYMHSKPHLGSHGPPGAVVYTETLQDLEPISSHFLNSDHGAAMNINAAAGGTPLGVHNGIDSALWAGSNISGNKVQFSHTGRPQTGTRSVRVDNPALNDTWQFDNGSNISPGAYVSLTFSINIDKDWDGNDEVQVYAYDTGGGVDVGARVDLTDYVNETSFDVWQDVAIPFTDLGIEGLTFDAIRMSQSGRSGKAAKWYLDDMFLQETGTPLVWSMRTPGDTAFYIDRLRFTFADALAGTVTSGTMPGLAYDQLLGLAKLSNGIVLTRVHEGITRTSESLRQLGDFLGNGFTVTQGVSDGTNTLIVLELAFRTPIILHPNDPVNYLRVVISDDLSGLLEMSATAIGAEVVAK